MSERLSTLCVIATDDKGNTATYTYIWQDDNSIVEHFVSEIGERTNELKEACDCCAGSADLQMTLLFSAAGSRLIALAEKLAARLISDGAKNLPPEVRERLARADIRDARRSPSRRRSGGHNRRPN